MRALGFWRKIKEPQIWRRIFYERLSEPLHLNALSVLIALFGSYRMRINFDLVVRHQNAFAILKAADYAKKLGIRRIAVAEFGVATGAGLMNMCLIAERVTAITGIAIDVYGFDTGGGMPAARDYRDHPDLYWEGDFPMDLDSLRQRLPRNGQLVIGDIEDTVPHFLRDRLSSECPIGYVAIDVDYYSSTVSALRLLQGDSKLYLPISIVYLDDIELDPHNPFAGELLAIGEFNNQSKVRKICRHEFLENQRLFRRTRWIKHMYYLHVMDHPTRSEIIKNQPARVIKNPYLA